MATLVGLDLGTTNCKAVAVTAGGRVLATASSSYGLHSPQPGWAEQDVRKVWQGVIRTLHALRAQLSSRQVDGLCLSGAMHSMLLVDKHGAALCPAMTWADNRAAPCVERLRARVDAAAMYQRTGCPLRSTYHPVRLRWWVEERPQLARRAARFVAIKDWILHQLTGLWATDFGLASTTGLLDIRQLTWDQEALSAAGVSEQRLPSLVSPSAVVGGLTKQAAEDTGLSAQLPVVAGSSDGALANLGAGAVEAGQVVVTVGTSGAIRKVLDDPWLDSRERTWCYLLAEGRWFAGGAINNGGLALQWVRQQLYGELAADAGYRQLLEDAASVPPGAGGVLLLPYLAGERSPHWDPAARAVIHGLGLEHTRAHVARAALEGVAFCLADVWEALAGDEDQIQPARLTGAIADAPVWAQVVADVLGISLAPIRVADASALGAAILGNWALGNSKELGAHHTPRLSEVFEPDAHRHSLYARRHKAFQSLYRRLL